MRRPSRMHVAQAQPLPCPRQVTDGKQLQVDGMRARSRACLEGHKYSSASEILSEDVPVRVAAAPLLHTACHVYHYQIHGLMIRAILFNQALRCMWVGR